MKNNRTFLEKLLDGAEVEWKPLKDVAEYIRGVTYNKANESTNNIGYKVLRANNITLSSNTLNFDDIKVIKFDTKVKSSQMLYKNDILISAASGSREHVGKVAFIYQDIDYYFGGFMGVIRCNNNVNPRYLFHIFTSSIFQDYLNEVLNSSTINNLNSKVMDSFRLPIPPLSVQTEIVRILDALTALTSELTSELTLRRKLYEYYLDNLLSKEELGKIGFEWKCLKDICDYVDFRGKTPKKTESGIFLVTAKNIKKGFIDYNASKEFVSESDYIEIMRRGLPRIGDVLITTEAPCGNVAQIDKEDIALAQRVIKYRSSNENILDNTFLKFMLLSKEFQVNLIKLSTGGTVKGIKGSTLHKMKIKIPPIDEQKRIVSILEKFEILTNSITEGLPLAIEQSQKRYEYYRELLLSFNGSNQ